MCTIRCGRPSLALVKAAMVVVVPACGGPPAAAPATQPVTVAVPGAARSTEQAADAGPAGRFRCEVAVRALGAQFVGEASSDTGATGETLTEEAEQEACKKLWKAEKVDCKDERKVATVSRQTKYSVVNGKASLLVRVVLRSLGGPYRGAGASPQSGQDACRRAVADACRKAPAGSECSGRGLYCSASRDDLTVWHCSSDPPQGPPRGEPSPFEA